MQAACCLRVSLFSPATYHLSADEQSSNLRIGTGIVLAPHQTITDPTHEQARRELQARREVIRTRVDLEVEVRDLSVYDRLVGVA